MMVVLLVLGTLLIWTGGFFMGWFTRPPKSLEVLELDASKPIKVLNANVVTTWVPVYISHSMGKNGHQISIELEEWPLNEQR
jgi:hypothetical protein